MMNDPNNRKKSFLARFFLNQKMLALLGLVILIFISVPLAKNRAQRREIKKEINDIEQEINRVENKNNELRKLIDYFESGEFLEEQARLNFGLKKSGEEAVVIKDNSLTSTGAIISSRLEDQQIFSMPGSNADKKKVLNRETNISRWRAYFFR